MTGKRKVIYHILYPVVNSDQSIALKCEETSEFVSLSGKVALSKRDIDKRRLDSQPTRLVGISVQSWFFRGVKLFPIVSCKNAGCMAAACGRLFTCVIECAFASIAALGRIGRIPSSRSSFRQTSHPLHQQYRYRCASFSALAPCRYGRTPNPSLCRRQETWDACLLFLYAISELLKAVLLISLQYLVRDLGHRHSVRLPSRRLALP